MSSVITAIEAADASSVLRQVLERLSSPAESSHAWERNAPRGLPIRELRHCWYRLRDTTRCAAYLPLRRLNYSFMAAEFVWIFCGMDDVEMISYYNKEIARFSDDGKTFFGAYGPRWRGQIEVVAENLRRDPDSRQGVVGLWRPEALTAILDDVNDSGEFEARMPSRDVPCTLSMQYLIRNGRLEAGVVMRSSDAWLGLPYDLFNFSMLQRALAAELKVEPGALTLYIGSSHLYERDLERVREVLDAEARLFAAGETDLERVPIPGLPGLESWRLERAERAVRRDYADADVDKADAGEDWQELLSVLAYRKHKDATLVLSPWRELVTAP